MNGAVHARGRARSLVRLGGGGDHLGADEGRGRVRGVVLSPLRVTEVTVARDGGLLVRVSSKKGSLSHVHYAPRLE